MLDLASLLRIGRRTVRFCNSLISRMKKEVDGGSVSAMQMATLMTLAQMVRHYEAAVLLRRKGFGEQVYLVQRASYMLATYFEFINDFSVTGDEREYRAHVFLVYGVGRCWVESNIPRRGREFEYFEPSQLPERIREFYDWFVQPNLEQTTCRVKDYFYDRKGMPRTTFTSLIEDTSKKIWSGASEAKAREERRKELYSDRSSFAHANPDSIVQVLAFDERDNLYCGLPGRQLDWALGEILFSLIKLLGSAHVPWSAILSAKDWAREDEISSSLFELLGRSS